MLYLNNENFSKGFDIRNWNRVFWAPSGASDPDLGDSCELNSQS